MLLEIIISIAISYLLGSISPSYFFGKLIKNIDIRKYGTKNLGTGNVFYLLGNFYGALTLIVDVGKGVLAFLISNILIKAPETALIFSLFAIIGHAYPFYLKFKGGMGAAVTLGVAATSLFYTQSLFTFIIIFLLIIRTVYIFKYARKDLLKKYLKKTKLKIIKPWRKLYRFIFGLFFLFSYPLFGQKTAFTLILIAFIISLIFDLTRLFSKSINKSLSKKLKKLGKDKEVRNLSTTTYFLISALPLFYFFSFEIIFISILFFLIGDTLAEIFGSVYRKLLMGKKSIEGSFSGFLGNLIMGLLIMNSLNVSFIFILKAAFFSALIEFSSQKIDDNLTMPIGTAILLRIFQ